MMTHDEAAQKILIAEHCKVTGTFAEAEVLGRKLVNETMNQPGMEELHCRALLVLSEALNQLGMTKEAEPVAQQALELARSNGYRHHEATATENIAIVNMFSDNFDLALTQLQEALAIDEELDHKRGIAEHLGNIGIAYQVRSDYTTALAYLRRAQDVDQEIGYMEGVSRHIHNAAMVLTGLGDFAKALEYFHQTTALVEQVGNKNMGMYCLLNMSSVYGSLSDFPLALEYALRALALAEQLGNKRIEAACLGRIGDYYNAVSDYNRSLEYYSRALSMAEEHGSRGAMAAAIGSIGSIYAAISDQSRAMEYYTKAISINEEIGLPSGVAFFTGEIGSVHFGLRDYVKALEHFTRAEARLRELGLKPLATGHLMNMGQTQLRLGNFDSAEEVLNTALSEGRQLGIQSVIADATGFLGELYSASAFERHDYLKAEEHLLSAIQMNEELGSTRQLYQHHESLAALYEKTERWKEHSFHLKRIFQLQNEFHLEEVGKKAEQLQQRRDLAEREKLLTAERARAGATQEILYKVLPSSVADRLIRGEKVADYFPQISILFADIVGFTAIASEIPPDVVIDLLNFVFDRFDDIVKKHGCEKVKTIGDGYMAVSGAPEECSEHAERMARVALEMQQDITLPEEIREQLPTGISFGVRVGIHTGSAVCGVMGRERFVWDIYSDAVNTAARMESSGESGKIHVSKEFAWLLRSRQKLQGGQEEFNLLERGEMEIKGKGRMRTYFLE